MALVLNGNGTISGANLNIDSDGAASFNSLTVDTNTLYVDAVNNRVGVNTSTPTAPLDVTGNVFAKALEIKATSDALTHGVAIHSSTLNALQFNTNSTERMQIDGSGRVTTPYNPAFVAFMSANHTTTSNGQLPFDSLSTEIPSQRSAGYSTANRRFTAPVTGLYQFSVSLDFAGNYSNYYFWCGINGGGRYRDFLENVDILTNGGFYSTFSIHMTAGDYIQLHSGVAGINLYGGTAVYNCVWQGHLIG